MANSKADALKEMALFRGLSKSDLEFLAANVDEVQIPAGTDLITEGRINHSMYVLRDGEVAVSVGGKHRRDMRAGDFFGEISMDALIEATAAVRTTTAVKAFVVSHSQFRAMKANPTVLLHLKEAIAARLENDRRADRGDL